nr:hypothetical protein [Tanacetum cinerariifolium]
MLGKQLLYYCLPCCAEKSKETKDLLSTLPLLIAHLGAVTFAAIYTARGGDSNDGMPVVVHKTSFKIFNFNECIAEVAGCRWKSYSKQINCLDDAAFADTDNHRANIS